MDKITDTPKSRHRRSLARMIAVTLIGTACMVAAVPSVQAATTCTFTISGLTMYLDADCTTDTTIEVPDGFTLDGQGNTITAVNNSTYGQFLDAVVANEAGADEMHIVNVIITTDNLGNVCDGSATDRDGDGRDDRLRGIMFQSANGTVVDTTVTDIKQLGESGCQEGNAIEIRNPPFSFEPAPHTDVGHPDTKQVSVSGSTIERYQKVGVVANGDVDVDIHGNTIVGLGPIDHIAQNGIQLGFGATGDLHDNDVSGNDYTPGDTSSVGILLYLSATTIAQNHVHDNEVGIGANFANGTLVENNRVFDSRTDGIEIIGSTNMTVLNNKVFRSGDDGIQVAGGEEIFSGIEYNATDNLIEKNKVHDSGDDGIVNNEDAQDNTYLDNRLKRSGDLSCDDNSIGTGTEGTANTWNGNNGQAPSDPEGICVQPGNSGNGSPGGGPP